MHPAAAAIREALTDALAAVLAAPVLPRTATDDVLAAVEGWEAIGVTGEQGEPLHLGRSNRLFTPAQKKSLAARDGGCAWPGCTAPVAWTDAHHVRR